MEIAAAADLRAPALHRWELATGLALGSDPPDEQRCGEPGRDPRRALDDVLTGWLGKAPCVVSFSGGRDSSAVLAAATAAARRHGLPDPIPVSLRFPGVPSTHESDWQELVIAHLGLGDWERVEVTGELDLLGPIARGALRRHGLLWPPNAHIHVPILDRARGGCVLTGFDGDGLFGLWSWERAQSVLHGRLSPRPRDVPRVALAFAPPRARIRWMHSHILDAAPWVRAESRAALEACVRTEAAREPRCWDRRIAYYRRRRRLSLTVRSLDLLAATRDVEVGHPLLSAAFLSALARHGGAGGYGDRTAAMRVLFGDLLPGELLSRRTKAEFSGVLWHEEAAAFAAAWDGRGVDTELVDSDRVRVEWTSRTPLFGANTLLQAAWLAAQPK